MHPPLTIKKRWTKTYRKWLGQLKFEHASEQAAFQEYLHAIRECEERVERLEASLVEQAKTCVHGPVIRALQGLRGVALINAITMVVEIGNFSRFRSPAQLMAYLGMVPREYSSGATTRRGSLTKAGNKRVRRAFVEAAWSYRHRPAIKGDLEKRLEGQSAHVQYVSWKAQNRLHKKYLSMVRRGKHKNLVIAAVGRELIGFVWSIAVEVEGNAAA